MTEAALEVLQTLSRWAMIMGVMALMGMALTRTQLQLDHRPRSEPVWGAILLLGTLLWLPMTCLLLVGSTATGISGDLWWVVATETRPGQMGLGMALISPLLWWSQRRGDDNVTVLAGLCGLLMLTHSGHPAAAEDGWGLIGQLNQVFHLFCLAAWLGSFPFFSVWLAQADSRALQRWSQRAKRWVLGIVITGVIAVMIVLQRWPQPEQTRYDFYLSLKVMVFLVMLGCAGGVALAVTRQHISGGQRALRAEQGLGLLLVVMAVFMAHQSPHL